MPMGALLELCRPQQWLKNIFVFIPIIFSRKFFEPEMVLLSIEAFFIFILASSSVYVLNDLMDYKKDMLHPDKKKRPIAAGKVSPNTAWGFWMILMLLTLVSSYYMSPYFLAVVVGYLIMTMSYSFFLKKVIFLDVILIAIGFVFRVLAGGVAIDVLITGWLAVLVFLFTLFLSISKRRQELKNLEKRSKHTRYVLGRYTIDLIDQLNAIIVPIVITSYIIYTFSERENNVYFILTIPLIVYCFFRYLYLLKHTSFGESSRDYTDDWQLMIVALLWFGLAMMGLGI